ncbi:MAG: FAD-binding oxidoreductase [Rubripirellula sp.]|jgi:ferredoxin-NADP reductase/DMSO/TMAO reductase YedYZ heme-binding membrane subunit|nr:FAD-binding oxidoreductase [Rubripirellula sp.]
MKENIAYFRNLVVIAGAGPLIMLTWDAWHGQLGANAVNNAIHITGILSLVFLFLSLLITPVRVVTGWSSLVAYRRALGLYGFAYAALHFSIYVIYDRMGSLSSTIDEIVTRRFLLVGFVGLSIMLPLAVTSTNGMIRRLGPVRWKWLHRLTYTAAILGVLHYYMLVKSDVRQPLAFAAVLTPILGFRAVKHYTDLRQKAFSTGPVTTSKNQTSTFYRGELLVANIRRETHDVKTFRFINPDGGDIPFVHRPGQYMTLTLEIEGQTVKRSYTIASSPSQRGYVELTIKRDEQGTASRFLHDSINAGDRIRIAAPAGQFYFDGTEYDEVVLIAGGVGITPLMSILRYLTDHGWTGKIHFANAIRSQRDMIFDDELSDLVQRFEQLRVKTFFSRGLPEDERISNGAQPRIDVGNRWQSASGYMEAESLRDFIPNIQDLPVFLCGPDALMESMRQNLESIGVPSDSIATEAFVSLKPSNDTDVLSNGTNQGDIAESATVVFASSGQSIDISGQVTMLEAAEQAGVSLPFECRSGICGQCKVRCVSGRVHMESTDALTPGEATDGFILACQAQPVDEEIEIDA